MALQETGLYNLRKFQGSQSPDMYYVYQELLSLICCSPFSLLILQFGSRINSLSNLSYHTILATRHCSHLVTNHCVVIV